MRSLFSALLVLSCALGAGCIDSDNDGDEALKETQRQEDPRRDAFEAIKRYRGPLLTELEPDRIDELIRHLAQLGLERDKAPSGIEYEPWYFWTFTQKEPAHYLLLEADTSFVKPHPSQDLIRLTVLDDSGKVVSRTELQTGHRIGLWSAHLEYGMGDDLPLVVVHLCGLNGGGNQYYGWVDRRFDLIRLETWFDKPLWNWYCPEHFRCGPSPVEQTEGAWIADLYSGERLRMLRALVWLGGLHHRERDSDPLTGTPIDDADPRLLVHTVRANEVVTARIRALMQSEDRWLREAAELVADPNNDP